METTHLLRLCITESQCSTTNYFYYTVLFEDQHDNGRRVEDKKIGKCSKPYVVSEKEFLQSMDEILDDEELQNRVEKIGENMRKLQKEAMEGLKN